MKNGCADAQVRGVFVEHPKTAPKPPKNENRPKLTLKRRFKSSRFWNRIPHEKLYLKPSSKHLLMHYFQEMSFSAPMSTPETVHNGSGSQGFRFKRFWLGPSRVQPGPARPSPARPGPARPGPASPDLLSSHSLVMSLS